MKDTMIVYASNLFDVLIQSGAIALMAWVDVV
jgi:hypothetical protein